MNTLFSMKVFRQVVEAGSFVGAAERLEVSTAMTSKHVAHLEGYLGTRLLNRSSRSLSLTESGAVFYERCRVILQEVENAEHAVGSLTGMPRGTLRVSCPSWAGGRQFADLLAAYRTRYPEIIVDMAFEDRFVDLVEEGYDLALRVTADSPPAGLIARALTPMPFVIAASTSYLRRHGLPRSPSELADHDGVMIGDAQSWQLSGPDGRIEVPARVVLRFRSMSAASAHAVCAGMGLAALPRMMLEDPMFAGILHPVLPEYSLQTPQLYALYVSRQHVPPKIRTFIDHMVESIEAATRARAQGATERIPSAVA